VTRPLARHGSALGLALTLALLGGPQRGVAAGNEAEVQRMIESLRPAASASRPAPATRTRNLVIEPAAAPAPSAAAPVAAPTLAAPAATPPTAAPAAPQRPATAPAAVSATTSAATPAPGAASPGLSLAIAFEPNSAQIRPDSGGTLGALVAAMLSAELRQQRFVIEGHTDASGTPAQNLRLSRERAEQVRLYLVTLGVDGERLRAVGKGSTEPANARDPRSPENRRVRVVAMP
jgi:outer membrane protein OmpA-like peptidoglycan-associated protein